MKPEVQNHLVLLNVTIPIYWKPYTDFNITIYCSLTWLERAQRPILKDERQQLKISKAAKYISSNICMTSRPVAKVIVKTKLDLTGGGHTLAPPPWHGSVWSKCICIVYTIIHCIELPRKDETAEMILRKLFSPFS